MAKTPTKIRKRSLWDLPEIVKREDGLDHTIAHTDDRIRRSYEQSLKYALEEYLKLYDEITTTGADKVLHSKLYRSNRLYELMRDIEKNLNKMYVETKSVITRDMVNLYKENLKIVKKSYGFNPSIDHEKVKQTVNQYWLDDGHNWSDRLWSNKEELLDKMELEASEIIITGKTYAESAKAISDLFGVSYRQAERLVRTEMSHIQVLSTLDSYKDMGITKYQILTAAGDRVCPTCSGLGGQEFNIADREYGVNCPPLHPNCRCTVIAVKNYAEMAAGSHNKAFKQLVDSTYAQYLDELEEEVESAGRKDWVDYIRKAKESKWLEFLFDRKLYYEDYIGWTSGWAEQVAMKLMPNTTSATKIREKGSDLAFQYLDALREGPNYGNKSYLAVTAKERDHWIAEYKKMEAANEAWRAERAAERAAKEKALRKAYREARKKLIEYLEKEKAKKEAKDYSEYIEEYREKRKKQDVDFLQAQIDKLQAKEDELKLKSHLRYEKRKAKEEAKRVRQEAKEAAAKKVASMIDRVCIDCGKTFKVSPKNTSSLRCSSCQAKWRRKYEAERKRNKRKAEKLLKNKDKK